MFMCVSSVPDAPVIDSVEVTFNQLTGIITAVITPNDNLVCTINTCIYIDVCSSFQFVVQNAPPNIAESGTKVLDGSIRGYTTSLMIGDTPTSCEGLTCTAAVSEGFSTTPFVITVAARNAVGTGPSTMENGVGASASSMVD